MYKALNETKNTERNIKYTENTSEDDVKKIEVKNKLIDIAELILQDQQEPIRARTKNTTTKTNAQ